MKIAMVSGHASPLVTSGAAGGIAQGRIARSQHVHVAELSAALAGRGHDVRVYTRRDDPEQPVSVTPDGHRLTVVHVPVGPPQRLATDDLLPLAGDLGRWLADRWANGDFRPDVVHAHHWISGLAALTATAETYLPVAVTYHELGTVARRLRGEDAGPPTRVGLERTLGDRADRVLAQSQDEATELGRMGIRRAAVAVVPAGVDIDRFDPAGPRVERPGDLRRVLAVGRLVERSGFGDLIAALRRVPDTELTIIGGPAASGTLGSLDADPEVVRLRALAERYGLAGRVRFIGGVPHADLPAWYRSADVVACVPAYEPFGLVAVEAMACGVPVVGYAVGGIAESVIDGVTGVLVPPRDTGGLAAGLRALLGDEMRRMSYGSAAVDRVRSRYTWDRAASDTERVYQALTGSTEPATEDDDELTEVS